MEIVEQIQCQLNSVSAVKDAVVIQYTYLIIIFSILQMFFGNPELLQRNLHNDLNTLIKNIKSREDQYLTLLQYNKNLIASIGQNEHIAFFPDQIAKHKSFHTSSVSAHQKMSVQENETLQKYSCAISGEQTVVKLLGRVTARVLEICQASSQKGKFLDASIMDKFNEFKAKLMSCLNQGGKINIQEVLEVVVNYSVQKDKKEIQRLQQIIKILITGDYLKLPQIYSIPKPQPKKYPPIPQKKQKPVLSLQKPKQKSPQKLRQQQQRANLQKTKKKKAKISKQLLNNFYSVMDLSKQQFLDDLNYCHNPEEKKKRLFEEIFSRNKFNHDQILQFQAKKEEFEAKVKEFKEMMELQSKKIQQALVVVINRIAEKPVEQKTPVKIQRKQTKSDVDDDQQEQTTASPQKLDRVFRRRQRRQKNPSPRFPKESAFSSMQSTQYQQGFQHIKFDVKNQQVFSRSNRARLPQIQGRSSLDSRYDKKNDSRFSEHPNNPPISITSSMVPSMNPLKKQEKRINIMKNIQIGTLNNSVAKNSFNEPNNITVNNNAINRRSPRDKAMGEPLFQQIAMGNVNLNSNGLNGMDYTFYVRKKITTKFYQTKNNFVL